MTYKLTITLPPWDVENWQPTTAELLLREDALVLGPVDNFRRSAFVSPATVSYVTIKLPADEGPNRTVEAKVRSIEVTDDEPTVPEVDIDVITNPCACVKTTHLTFVQVTNQE